MSPKDTTPTDRLQQIRDALDELRLADMKTQLERELAQGDSHWLDRVGRLLEAQRRARRERAIERRIDEARFPAPKSLDNFDFDFQTGVDRDQILHLATLDWLARRESLLVAGMSGTGKSHIAIALGHLACVEGYRVRYTTSADMLTVLHLALATQDLQQATKPFVRCELLIIDEVGLDKPERQAYKTHDASLFYKVVAARYQAGRSCVITTNIKWDNWGEYLGDEVATAAILDRLVHHSHAISIDGPSWRVRQHAQLNRDEGNVGD
jgi:DNA replication protein DnaC